MGDYFWWLNQGSLKFVYPNIWFRKGTEMSLAKVLNIVFHFSWQVMFLEFLPDLFARLEFESYWRRSWHILTGCQMTWLKYIEMTSSWRHRVACIVWIYGLIWMFIWCLFDVYQPTKISRIGTAARHSRTSPIHFLPKILGPGAGGGSPAARDARDAGGGWVRCFNRGFHEQNRDIIVKQLGNPDYWNRTIEWDMMFTHQPHDVDLVKIVNLHSRYGHVTMLFLLLIGRWCFQLSTPGWNGLPYF